MIHPLLHVALIWSIEVPSSFWGCQSKTVRCISWPIFERAVLFRACAASFLQVYRILRLRVSLLVIVAERIFLQNAPLILPLATESGSCMSEKQRDHNWLVKAEDGKGRLRRLIKTHAGFTHLNKGLRWPIEITKMKTQRRMSYSIYYYTVSVLALNRRLVCNLISLRYCLYDGFI